MNTYELHTAARTGDAAAAKRLLAADPSLAAELDWDLMLPLHYAARGGHLALAQRLLRAHPNGAFSQLDYSENPDNERMSELFEKWGYSPLHFAAEAGHAAMVELLLRAAPEAVQLRSEEDGLTPLDCAAMSGHEAATVLLVQATPAEAAAAPAFRDRLLFMAAKGGLMSQVQQQLEAGACSTAEPLLAALRGAVGSRRAEVVRLLLDTAAARGVAVDGAHGNRGTLLHAALWSCSDPIVRMVLAAGPAAASAVDEQARTPLHVCARAGLSGAIVELILAAAPASASAVDSAGRTPLHEATAAGNAALAELLLHAAPATASMLDSQGRAPVHHALERGLWDLARQLLRAAPEMAARVDSQGSSLLHLAAWKRCSEPLFRELLDAAPALVMAMDEKGRTPLACAAIGNCKSAVQVLLEAAPEAALLPDNEGRTPLLSGIRFYSLAMLLLDAQPAAASMGDVHGCTPLHEVAGETASILKEQVQQQVEALARRLLLEAPATAAAQETTWGELPLHRAAKCANELVLRLLLAADTITALTQDYKGFTALHCASRRRFHANMLHLLAAAPSAATTVSAEGWTPLHVAAHGGDYVAVQLLCQATPSTSWARATDGRTPLDIALDTAADPDSLNSGVVYADGSCVNTAAACVLASCALLDAAAPGGPDPSGLLLTVGKLGKRGLPLYAHIARRWPLQPGDWARLPSPCPGLEAALPAVLARSGGGEEAHSLVAHLAEPSRQRLRTVMLCLARLQRQLGLQLPVEVVLKLLGLFEL